MASVSVPKYMQITVEYTKPGKGGLAHDKTESAFVEAVTKAKFPIHYIAFNSLSGPARAIYMSHFDSFEAMQTANKVFEANAAEFERINVDDGELLESTKQLIFKYVPELSYHPHGPNPHAHYLEARILHVRSGHRKEFEDLVKMWMAVSDKAGSANHWGAYRVQYGDQVGTYVFLTSDNSMADIDNSSAEGPKFMAVLSEADRQGGTANSAPRPSTLTVLSCTPSILLKATLPKSSSRPIRISGRRRLPPSLRWKKRKPNTSFTPHTTWIMRERLRHPRSRSYLLTCI